MITFGLSILDIVLFVATINTQPQLMPGGGSLRLADA